MEPDSLTHSEFLSLLEDQSHLWGVRRLHAAVRAAFGTRGALAFSGASVAILLPAAGLAAYALVAWRPALLPWAALALLGFLAGHPGPTAVGIATSLLVAAAGYAISLTAGQLHLLGGFLPGATWFASCAVKGVTMQYLDGELRRSPELLRKLIRDNNFVLVPRS